MRLESAASEQPGGLQKSPEISRYLKGLQGAGGKLCSVGCTQLMEKITKQEVQEKKTELHGKQRQGKKGWAGQVFQAINGEGGGFRKYIPKHKTGRYCHGREGGGKKGGDRGGRMRGVQRACRSLREGKVFLRRVLTHTSKEYTELWHGENNCNTKVEESQ